MAVRVRGSPTLDTLALIAVVFLCQQLVSLLSPALAVSLFAVSMPLEAQPWTLVTNVYAHASLGHLLSNAVIVLVTGLLVERVTTRLRFHAFVVTTGVLAAVAETTLGGVFGPPSLVLGISGAALALVGYVVAGNPVAEAAVGRLQLGHREQIAVVLVLAMLAMIATAGENVAMIAHFVGFALGMIAGRLRLLHVPKTQASNKLAR